MSAVQPSCSKSSVTKGQSCRSPLRMGKTGDALLNARRSIGHRAEDLHVDTAHSAICLISMELMTETRATLEASSAGAISLNFLCLEGLQREDDDISVLHCSQIVVGDLDAGIAEFREQGGLPSGAGDMCSRNLPALGPAEGHRLTKVAGADHGNFDFGE